MPLLPGMIEESLPLSREVPVAGWDTEEEGIVAFQDFWGDERNCIGLTGGVHQLKHLFRQSLLDPRRKPVSSSRWARSFILASTEGVTEDVGLLVQISFSTSGLDAGFLRLCKLLDMSIHGVLQGRSAYASNRRRA